MCLHVEISKFLLVFTLAFLRDSSFFSIPVASLPDLVTFIFPPTGEARPMPKRRMGNLKKSPLFSFVFLRVFFSFFCLFCVFPEARRARFLRAVARCKSPRSSRQFNTVFFVFLFFFAECYQLNTELLRQSFWRIFVWSTFWHVVSGFGAFFGNLLPGARCA